MHLFYFLNAKLILTIKTLQVGLGGVAGLCAVGVGRGRDQGTEHVLFLVPLISCGAPLVPLKIYRMNFAKQNHAEV